MYPTQKLDEMLMNLKSIRLSRGLSRKFVAEALNVPVGTYRNWEQCVSKPQNAEALKAVADFFDVSIDELYGRPYPNLQDVIEEREESGEEFKDGELVNYYGEKGLPIIGMVKDGGIDVFLKAVEEINDSTDPDKDYSMTSDEEDSDITNLVSSYYRLNQRGKGLVTKYIEILVTHPDYSIEYHIVRIDETVEEGEIK